jgi:hypothetical protein
VNLARISLTEYSGESDESELPINAVAECSTARAAFRMQGQNFVENGI